MPINSISTKQQKKPMAQTCHIEEWDPPSACLTSWQIQSFANFTFIFISSCLFHHSIYCTSLETITTKLGSYTSMYLNVFWVVALLLLLLYGNWMMMMMTILVVCCCCRRHRRRRQWHKSLGPSLERFMLNLKNRANCHVHLSISFLFVLVLYICSIYVISFRYTLHFIIIIKFFFL